MMQFLLVPKLDLGEDRFGGWAPLITARFMLCSHSDLSLGTRGRKDSFSLHSSRKVQRNALLLSRVMLLTRYSANPGNKNPAKQKSSAKIRSAESECATRVHLTACEPSTHQEHLEHHTDSVHHTNGGARNTMLDFEAVKKRGFVLIVFRH